MKLRELADYLRADLVNPPDKNIEIKGVAPLPQASSVQVSFITNEAYLAHASSSQAAAIIVKTKIEGVKAAQLVHPNPYYAFAKTAQIFHKPQHPDAGISEHAVVEEGVEIGKNVTIMPFSYVSSGTRIADNVVIYSGVSIGKNVTIGEGSVLYPNVTIYADCKIGKDVMIHSSSVIGSDGFGFAPGESDIAKIPQVGGVVIEDHVEIGAMCSVDAGTMTPTRVGKGSKIDSHCHIAHNCNFGEHSMLCGTAAMAGSATVGNWCVIGGATNISNNVVIGDRIRVGGMAGVQKSISEPGDYMGFPIVTSKEWRKEKVLMRRLPKLEERIKELEAQIKELASQSTKDA